LFTERAGALLRVTGEQPEQPAQPACIARCCYKVDYRLFAFRRVFQLSYKTEVTPPYDP